MIKYNLSIISLLFVLHDCSCFGQPEKFIPFTDSRIAYEGRIGRNGECAILYWSGTQIEVNFTGTELSAVCLDNFGDNYYNLILDNDSIRIFRPDTAKRKHLLFSNLKDEKHNLKIYKRTEWNRGRTFFYGFVTGEGTELIMPQPPKKRKMEFYGNSITAGYGIEDFSGEDRADSIFTNNYLTYAALTARHFNAQCHYIVRSGIGIMVSWFPVIMPELYNRLDPENASSEWDFSRYQPDLVVINLLQNDAYLLSMPRSKEYLFRFSGLPKPDETYITKAYADFVLKIREKYPKAKIICMLGNLSITKKGSPWPDYVLKALKQINDQDIHALFIPYKNTPGHPRVDEQKKMADLLIRYIEKNIHW